MSLILGGLLFIAFLETAFPSYTVCTIDSKTQEQFCYGVPKSSIETDESGMIDLEALANGH